MTCYKQVISLGISGCYTKHVYYCAGNHAKYVKQGVHFILKEASIKGHNSAVLSKISLIAWSWHNIDARNQRVSERNSIARYYRAQTHSNACTVDCTRKCFASRTWWFSGSLVWCPYASIVIVQIVCGLLYVFLFIWVCVPFTCAGTCVSVCMWACVFYNIQRKYTFYEWVCFACVSACVCLMRVDLILFVLSPTVRESF